jgi:glycosyltransferase involved in cell wall biosynthesis
MRGMNVTMNSGTSISADLGCVTDREYSHDFQPRVCVVIPAFNEESRIGSTLSQWKRFLDECFTESYEILVVMDGCTDRTVSIVSELVKDSEGRITPYNYPRRLGKGGALIEAFKQCRSDVLFFTDADGSVPAPELYKFMKAVGQCDLVVGSRYFRGSDFAGNLPVRRLLLSRAFNVLLKIAFPRLRPLHDTQCGAKAVHKRTLDLMGDDLFITDFGFDVNLIYSTLRQGLKVGEIPIQYNHLESESKISRNLLKVSFAMLLSTIRLRFYYSGLKPSMERGLLKRIIEFFVSFCNESSLV